MASLPGTSPQIGVEAMTLRGSARGVQTPVSKLSSGEYRREPPYAPKTWWVRLDQRREINAWIRCKMRCLNRHRFGSWVEPTTHCFFIRSKLRQRSRAPSKYKQGRLVICCDEKTGMQVLE